MAYILGAYFGIPRGEAGLRILWHSVSPICNTGYGIITRKMLPLVRDRGHFVRIATRHVDHPWQTWNGFEIFEGINLDHVNEMLEDEAFDIIFTLWDIWQMDGKTHFPKEKWVAYIPIDAQCIPVRLANVAVKTSTQIAMSRHGMGELQKLGLNPRYGPHGVFTEEYHPKPEARQRQREIWGLKDKNFLIGAVGLNYGDDRKGFFPLMQAFRIFHERHPEARLYIHTHWPGILNGTVKYHQIATALGIDKWITVPNQQYYDMGRISREQLATIYNTFDVFCLPTRGEGFGLPTVEAQACGVPAIVTDNTTGPELCASGWLIQVDELDDMYWTLNQGWRWEPRPSEVLKQLEIAYEEWRIGGDKWRGRKKQAENVGQSYAWEMIWNKYWIPIFEHIEKTYGTR